MNSKYSGNDNFGRPKSRHLETLSEMHDEELSRACYQMIYQSARCNNNPLADWHWMVDACYDEANRRDDEASIYVDAYENCYADHAEGQGR